MEDFEYIFVQTIPDKLICNICTDILRDPHLTGCCGQHFCLSCLRSWFKKHRLKSCPHCRARNFSHLLDKSVQREINQLEVYCSHYDDGCRWTGGLCNLQAHLQSEDGCGYELVSCPNDCPSLRGMKVKRKDLTVHLETECYLRRYTCQYCGCEDTYQKIMSPLHANCPAISFKCPNGCGKAGLKHKDLRSHQKKCPLEPVNCPNGCSTVTRRHIRYHIKHCPLRPYTCEHCGFHDNYVTVTQHHRPHCPRIPIYCPNNCGASFYRYQNTLLLAHRLVQCPLEVVSCPLCSVRLPREVLDDLHMPMHGFRYFMLICIMINSALPRQSYKYYLLNGYVNYAVRALVLEQKYIIGLCFAIYIILWLLDFSCFYCCTGTLLGLGVIYAYTLPYIYYCICWRDRLKVKVSMMF